MAQLEAGDTEAVHEVHMQVQALAQLHVQRLVAGVRLVQRREEGPLRRAQACRFAGFWARGRGS